MINADQHAKSFEVCVIDGKPLTFKPKFSPRRTDSWRNYKPNVAECTDCGAAYERPQGVDFAYRVTRNGYLVCTRDDAEILAIERTHPIHDGLFPLSGSGEVQYETIPYCPIHEQQPSPQGHPIDFNPGDLADMEIISRIRPSDL